MVEDKVNAWSYQAPKTECRRRDAILEPTTATVLRPEYSLNIPRTRAAWKGTLSIRIPVSDASQGLLVSFLN